MGVSIDLKYSDYIEADEDRARKRSDWIAKFHRKQQDKEEKRQMQAASEKMKQL